MTGKPDEKDSFFETEIARREFVFGNIAHALSSLLSSIRDLIHSLFGQLNSFSLEPRYTRPLYPNPQLAVA
jgi:hypothetical protein